MFSLLLIYFYFSHPNSYFVYTSCLATNGLPSPTTRPPSAVAGAPPAWRAGANARECSAFAGARRWLRHRRDFPRPRSGRGVRWPLCLRIVCRDHKHGGNRKCNSRQRRPPVYPRPCGAGVRGWGRKSACPH